MGSDEFRYLVQILLAEQDKKSEPFSANKRDVNVTATIRIASTKSPALACSAPQQKIANMYNPTEAFALPA